jgi:predicted alpha/beta-hydrolase family hydrolase
VLEPMEPVAPRIVTLRTAAGIDLARFAVGIKVTKREDRERPHPAPREANPP